MTYIKVQNDKSVIIGGEVASSEMIKQGWTKYEGKISKASRHLMNDQGKIVIDMNAMIGDVTANIMLHWAHETEAVRVKYTEHEESTFRIQQAEARLVKTGTKPTVKVTPFLKAYCGASGVSIKDHVDKVTEKSCKEAAVMGGLLGKRDALIAEAHNCKTYEDIISIQWDDPIDTDEPQQDEDSSPVT